MLEIRQSFYNVQFIFTAPTSSTNPDEEDIDIVGDDGNNNKNNNNNSSLQSSSESSRDLQLHVYGPPQFTEADVLACMNELEELQDREEDDSQETEKNSSNERTMVVKREVASPALSGSTAEDEESCAENNKNNPATTTATTTTSFNDKTNLKIKIKMEDKSKCSKCLVCEPLFFIVYVLFFFLAIYCQVQKGLKPRSGKF